MQAGGLRRSEVQKQFQGVARTEANNDQYDENDKDDTGIIMIIIIMLLLSSAAALL